MTDYVVLQASQNTPDGWYRIGPDSVRASSADAAIRQVATTRTEETAGGAYVAVPLRSWKPLKVMVATKPTVTIESAS